MNREAIKHPGLNLGEHHGSAHIDAEKIVFGFWVFLMSDLIIFGLMFATYVSMLSGTAGGPGPADVFNLKSAFIQTMILLTSSLTFGFGSLAMRHEHNPRALLGWLAVTLLLGIAFLYFEGRDFTDMFAKGATPMRSGFLSAFFGLVPLHGLHVASGCLWIILMMVQIGVFGMIPMVKTRILRLGLFWHFLDIVWIGIFSIVYLAGLA
ncbi:MAG: cytochrome o ubiquinol oxidase subunit III [Alphaproteobacteria bacterium]|nr:MAG: cytochrome o ubiquinol oxidase subunit III [Alphaproteobacteria bacterium]